MAEADDDVEECCAKQREEAEQEIAEESPKEPEVLASFAGSPTNESAR